MLSSSCGIIAKIGYTTQKGKNSPKIKEIHFCVIDNFSKHINFAMPRFLWHGDIPELIALEQPDKSLMVKITIRIFINLKRFLQHGIQT